MTGTIAGGYFAPKQSHPPKAGAFVPRKSDPHATTSRKLGDTAKRGAHPFAHKEGDSLSSGFRKLYDRGDFPISVSHDAKGNKINWKVCTLNIG